MKHSQGRVYSLTTTTRKEKEKVKNSLTRFVIPIHCQLFVDHPSLYANFARNSIALNEIE